MSSEVPANGPRIDEAATREAKGSVLPGGSGVGSGISIGGWEIRTSKGPIAGERACDALRASLCAGGAPALPEQLYGSSKVEATHLATGVTISFSAEGALRAWMRAQGKGREEGAAAGATAAAAVTTARPRVPAAERWRASRAREIAEHGAPELDYDWTFTCPYGGDVEVRRRKEDEEEGEGSEGEEATAATAASAAKTSNDVGSSGKEHAGPSQPAWLPTSDRLDRAALSARDPLLLWDEVLLCASELDDCGHSECGVRVRAMPGRWFALARCFVRVDGVLVRLLESRVVATFHGESGVLDVLREMRHSEGEFRDLVAAGAPGFESGGGSLGGGGVVGGAYADADSAAQALSAVAPVGVTRFVTERLALVP